MLPYVSSLDHQEEKKSSSSRKYRSSLHHHLLYASRSHESWQCYGFKEGYCSSGEYGIPKDKVARYRCRDCNFDICKSCLSQYGTRPLETFSANQIVEFSGLRINSAFKGLRAVILYGTLTPSSYRVKVSTTGEEITVSGRFLTSTLSPLKPSNSPLSAPPERPTSSPLPAYPKPPNSSLPSPSKQPVPTASSTPTYVTPCCGNCPRELKLTSTSPGSYKEGYKCNECRTSHRAPYQRWFCQPCGYDLCRRCAEYLGAPPTSDSETEGEPELPTMVFKCQLGDEYVKLAGDDEITFANLQKVVQERFNITSCAQVLRCPRRSHINDN